MKLVALSITDFTHELSSASPAPGGGSMAALCGALGAALCRMVANLTLGKEKYADAGPEMQRIETGSRRAADRLLKLVDEDTESYNRVMAAYKRPRDTQARQLFRREAIQDALKTAAKTPFRTLEEAAAALPMVKSVITHGNTNCITDAGVAADLIYTAARGAAYNVCINLMDITDDAFVSDLKKKTVRLLASVREETTAIREAIETTLNLEF